MAANKLRLTSLKLFQRYNFCNTYAAVRKSLYCTTKSDNPENSEPKDQKKSGFAKFDEKQTDLLKEAETEVSTEHTDKSKSGFAKFDKKQTDLLKEAGTEASADPTEQRLAGFAKFDMKQTELLEDIEKLKKDEPPASFISLLRNSTFVQLGDPVDKIVIGEIYHVVGRDLYIDFGWKFPTVCTAPERNRNLYVVGAKVKLLIKDLELATKFLGSEEEITLNEADCVLLGLHQRKEDKISRSQ